METLPEITPLVCPDCGQHPDTRRHLRHEKTCPFGRAEDERSDRDRRWFERHPDATEYRRALDPSEVATLRWTGAIPDGAVVVGTVIVTQLRPGVRLRHLADDAYYVVEGAA